MSVKCSFELSEKYGSIRNSISAGSRLYAMPAPQPPAGDPPAPPRQGKIHRYWPKGIRIGQIITGRNGKRGRIADIRPIHGTEAFLADLRLIWSVRLRKVKRFRRPLPPPPVRKLADGPRN